MKKEVADKWVEALRSGKYKQTCHGLRAGDRFCCLGVLCDISGLGEWKDEEYLEEILWLPDQVFEWAGISDVAQSDLAVVNDRGHSFNAIAERIEKKWMKL